MDAKTWTDLFAPLLAATVAGVVAWRLVPTAQDRWEKVKKHRELDLEAVREFHRVYGEFVSTWKVWDTSFRFPENFPMSPQLADECLRRATAIEGGIESLLVKVAAERRLADWEIDVLGATRQAFQSLRDAIRQGCALGWRHSEEKHYKALKALSAHTYVLLANSPPLDSQPSAEVSAANLLTITSNDYEEPKFDYNPPKPWVEIGNRIAKAAEDT